METKISSLAVPLRNSFRGEWGGEGMQGHLLPTPRPDLRGLPATQQPSRDPPNGQCLLCGVTLPPCPPTTRPPPPA